MHPYLFSIGGFKVPTFGVLMAIAILAAIMVARRVGKANGIDPDRIESASFWAVVASLIGSRFLYTFVEHSDHYLKHPIEFFYFRSGGLSFLGSIFFATATLYIFARKYRVPFLKLLDSLTPSVALGLAIGKIGCLMAGCCFGGHCSMPWGMEFNHPDTLAYPRGVPLHPSQIYESAMWLSMFFVLLWVRKRFRADGELFCLFLVVLGSGRFFFEFFRGDPGRLGPLTTAQMLGIPIVAVAAIAWFLLRSTSQTRDGKGG